MADSEIVVNEEVTHLSVEESSSASVVYSTEEGRTLFVTAKESPHFILTSEPVVEIVTDVQQGITGAKGERGEKGDKGERGEVGEKGERGEQGIQGEKGTGGDVFYLHRQDLPSTEWTIVHNLAKYPSITVIDSGNSVVHGDCIYIDQNSLKVLFSAPFSGAAYLN